MNKIPFVKNNFLIIFNKTKIAQETNESQWEKYGI
jgi:hypothetical protein